MPSINPSEWTERGGESEKERKKEREREREREREKRMCAVCYF